MQDQAPKKGDVPPALLVLSVSETFLVAVHRRAQKASTLFHLRPFSLLFLLPSFSSIPSFLSFLFFLSFLSPIVCLYFPSFMSNLSHVKIPLLPCLWQLMYLRLLSLKANTCFCINTSSLFRGLIPLGIRLPCFPSFADLGFLMFTFGTIIPSPVNDLHRPGTGYIVLLMTGWAAATTVSNLLHCQL